MEQNKINNDVHKNKFLTIIGYFFFTLLLAIAIFIYGFCLYSFSEGLILSSIYTCAYYWHSTFGIYFDFIWFVISLIIIIFSIYEFFIKRKIKAGFLMIIFMLICFFILSAIAPLTGGCTNV